MIRTLIFLFKYDILKTPENLANNPKAYFSLPEKVRKKVLDHYFKKLDINFDIAYYFNQDSARYYEDNMEISFFQDAYFDKKIIELNIANLKLIDKFKINEKLINTIIHEALNKLKKGNVSLNIDDILTYPSKLPVNLSKNIEFMTYLVKKNCYQVKYLTYNEACANEERELISLAVDKASKNPFDLSKFFVDNTLPNILKENTYFIEYMIKNDLSNVSFLTDSVLKKQTFTSFMEITKVIIDALKKDKDKIDLIEENPTLSFMLNRSDLFIIAIIELDLDNIKYIDWHNLNNTSLNKVIDYLTKYLTKNNIYLDINKYSFHQLFFQNYQFMRYLIEYDVRWIAYTDISNDEETDKLVTLFLKEYPQQNYQFNLNDFLDNFSNINHYLIENKRMLHYFFINKVPVVQHIDFFHLHHSSRVVENILKEVDKKDYEFNNDDFLKNGKYPVSLSNSYRFMCYVLDKNFNHLAYLDISMLNKQEIEKIVNYASRLVYFIRGDNLDLNFDIDGYFKGSDIVKNKYFQECYKCLAKK